MVKHAGRLELQWTNKDKALLSTSDGKYDYTFVEPSDRRVSEVRLLHEVDRVEAPTPPDRPEDLPEPTHDNLLITGDAMHVLDALAKIPEYAEKYLGKVKLVYIDPPFNTGQAFDNYEDNIEHSVWLTMLRDRLRQIRPLLAKDGSVWVHLDDMEVHRCRTVMDEELGAENFAGQLGWQKSDTLRNDAKTFSVDFDHILVYRASRDWAPNRMPRTAALDAIYKSPDGDPIPWFDGGPTAPGGHTHQGMVYGIQHPLTGELHYPLRGRHWALGQAEILNMMSEYADYELRVLDDARERARVCGIGVDEVRADVPAIMLSGSLETSQATARARYESGNWPAFYLRGRHGTGGIGKKTHLPTGGVAPATWWPHVEVGSNRTAKNEVKALHPGETPFDTPKPEALLSRIIHIGSNPGDIVMDCFAGTGTTAAVAHKMGRRWVTSELLSGTVERYTKTRLSKVVRALDPGGVTTWTERVPDVGLPGKMTADEAYQFKRALDTVVRSGDVALGVDTSKELARIARRAKKDGGGPLTDEETKTLLSLLRKVGDAGKVDITKQARSQFAAATKTREEVAKLWHGGGSFVHLEVGPSMFTEVNGRVLLADWATNGELARAMCAQLGVRHEPDGVFAGRRGRSRIAVIDGMVGVQTVEAIVEELLDGEGVEIWATQVSEDAKARLKKLVPVGRVNRIPEAVLDSYRRRAAKRSPFGGAQQGEAEK